MSRTDAELVRDALEHLEVLKQHLEMGPFENPLISDAVNMRLAAAIESLSQTSSHFRASNFGAEWDLMKAVRNRISHGYSLLDYEVIKATLEKDVPSLERTLRSVQDES